MSEQNEQNPQTEKIKRVLYSVEDVPTPHLCFLFGLQQAVMCVSGTLTVPYILSTLLCAGDQEDVRSKLMSLTLFMCGLATLLQTTIGVRLPIIQGGSHTFIAPIAAMMMLEKWKCPDIVDMDTSSNATDPDRLNAWKTPLREIQGNLMLASLTQVVVGCSGIIGFLLRFIGPLTIAPTIALIGLSLSGVVASFCEYQWGISTLSVALVILFSTVLNNIKIPCPAYSRRNGCHIIRFQLFGLFPVMLGIGTAWLFSFILTETDVFTSNRTLPSYHARTDYRKDTITNSPWFNFPLPFPVGMPTISAAGYAGMLAATISSIVESVGDYLAAARICDAPPPPNHALNRGIAVEGVASILSGLVGAGHGTTSYSGNIGEIAITRVASRRAFQSAALTMMFCGIFTKFGAFLATIPEPVIGGILLIGLGLVISIGVSSLQFCDLSSLHNLIIIAVSFMCGLMIPAWLQSHPYIIISGNTELDQVIRVLGGTATFVGGFLGCLLDNLLPGTDEERGIHKWRGVSEKGEYTERDANIYEFPFVMKCCRKFKILSYIPVSPTFAVDLAKCRCNSRRYAPKDYVYEHDIKHNELHDVSKEKNKVTSGIRL